MYMRAQLGSWGFVVNAAQLCIVIFQAAAPSAETLIHLEHNLGEGKDSESPDSHFYKRAGISFTKLLILVCP